MRLAFCILFLSLLQVSCIKSARDQKSIPPPPVKSDAARLSAAIQALSEVIKNNPSVSDNYFKRAVLNLKAEQYEDALADINRADQLKPNKGEYYFIKSKILKELGDNKALGVALNAESLDYSQPDLLVLIGELLTQRGEYAKADDYFNRAANIYPQNGDLEYSRGILSIKKGDTLSATRSFYSAMHLKPHVFSSYDQLIKIYNKRKMVDSALIINELSIKRFPQKKEMIFNKAQILENTGLLDSARITYERYLEVNPSAKEVLANIGMIYFRKKNYPAALTNFEKLIEAAPGNALAYHMAGKCKEQAGELDKAREYYEKALKISPEDQVMRTDLARINVKIENSYTVIRPF